MSSFSYDLPSYATSRPVHMNMDLCENKTLPFTILKQLEKIIQLQSSLSTPYSLSAFCFSI